MIEPWCVEYGMMPKDKFEIIEEEAEDDFYFHIMLEEKNIFDCAEGSEGAYPRVCQNGEELEFGHNLR